jgi:integrase
VTRRKWLPDNVTEYRDRHGKARYRFRKTGLPTYHFRHAPGTKEFLEELEKLPRFTPGSFDALIHDFYTTPRWQEMRRSSRTTYGGIIERFRQAHGSKPVALMETRHIDKLLGKMSDTPAAANNLRKTLRRLFRHAIKLGWIATNPVDATDAYRTTGDGYHTWTEAEIDQFDARWPLGTRERLAKELLLYSALRKGDMVTLGPSHRHGDKLRLTHTKNNSGSVIAMLPPLKAAIDALPSVGDTYLATQFGKPFTPAGFGNWFRDRCNKAGLPHCAAHGLRKAMSRRLAESGATNQEGKAVTGHKTDRMFSHYAAKANQEAMADRALANLAKRFDKGGSENG